KPPRKALALCPARQRGGNVSSFFTLPPPITVSSGCRAAVRRSTTSATRRRHFSCRRAPIRRARRSSHRCFFVRQVAELHRLYLAIDDKGGTESRSEAQKQHFAALVAAHSLQGGIIDDLHGAT